MCKRCIGLVLALLGLGTDSFNLQVGWEGLANLFRSSVIGKLESVGKSCTANLELGDSASLFDVDGLDVLSASSRQKFLDFLDFLRLFPH